jgi:hypothetical protein
MRRRQTPRALSALRACEHALPRARTRIEHGVCGQSQAGDIDEAIRRDAHVRVASDNGGTA